MLGSEPQNIALTLLLRLMMVYGQPLNLIIEVKGYRGEASIEKANTMKAFWVPGVNNLKNLADGPLQNFREMYLRPKLACRKLDRLMTKYANQSEQTNAAE